MITATRGLLLGLTLASLSGAALATWRPEYAQLSPELRKWFREQKVPGGGTPCCSEADGAQAQEDVVDGHYRARFTARRSLTTAGTVEEIDSGWMDVPDDVVIREPNRHGLPVVWWQFVGGQLRIRCFAPGAGL